MQAYHSDAHPSPARARDPQPGSSFQLRASVLNAALDIGFGGENFAKFMEGAIREEPETSDDVPTSPDLTYSTSEESAASSATQSQRGHRVQFATQQTPFEAQPNLLYDSAQSKYPGVTGSRPTHVLGALYLQAGAVGANAAVAPFLYDEKLNKSLAPEKESRGRKWGLAALGGNGYESDSGYKSESGRSGKKKKPLKKLFGGKNTDSSSGDANNDVQAVPSKSSSKAKSRGDEGGDETEAGYVTDSGRHKLKKKKAPSKSRSPSRVRPDIVQASDFPLPPPLFPSLTAVPGIPQAQPQPQPQINSSPPPKEAKKKKPKRGTEQDADMGYLSDGSALPKKKSIFRIGRKTPSNKMGVDVMPSYSSATTPEPIPPVPPMPLPIAEMFSRSSSPFDVAVKGPSAEPSPIRSGYSPSPLSRQPSDEPTSSISPSSQTQTQFSPAQESQSSESWSEGLVSYSTDSSHTTASSSPPTSAQAYSPAPSSQELFVPAPGDGYYNGSSQNVSPNYSSAPPSAKPLLSRTPSSLAQLVSSASSSSHRRKITPDLISHPNPHLGNGVKVPSSLEVANALLAQTIVARDRSRSPVPTSRAPRPDAVGLSPVASPALRPENNFSQKQQESSLTVPASPIRPSTGHSRRPSNLTIVPSSDYVVPSPGLSPRDGTFNRQSVLAYYQLQPPTPPPTGPLPDVPYPPPLSSYEQDSDSGRKYLSPGSVNGRSRSPSPTGSRSPSPLRSMMRNSYAPNSRQSQSPSPGPSLFNQPIPQVQRGKQSPFPVVPILPREESRTMIYRANQTIARVNSGSGSGNRGGEETFFWDDMSDDGQTVSSHGIDAVLEAHMDYIEPRAGDVDVDGDGDGGREYYYEDDVRMVQRQMRRSSLYNNGPDPSSYAYPYSQDQDQYSNQYPDQYQDRDNQPDMEDTRSRLSYISNAPSRKSVLEPERSRKLRNAFVTKVGEMVGDASGGEDEEGEWGVDDEIPPVPEVPRRFVVGGGGGLGVGGMGRGMGVNGGLIVDGRGLRSAASSPGPFGRAGAI